MFSFKDYNIIITMKLYNKNVPDTNDVVFVKILDFDDTYGTVNVSINDYNDINGMIIYSNIHKKLQKVKLFLKKNFNKSFPCSVYTIDDDDSEVIYLEPLKKEEEIKLYEKKYKLFEKIYILSTFLIDKNTELEDVINENFLWSIILNIYDTVDEESEKTFEYYLEHLDELFSFSELSSEIKKKFIDQINSILEINDIIYSINFNLELYSNNSLEDLNKMINFIFNNVKTLNYGSGYYKIVLNGKNIESCRNDVRMLNNKIIEFCNQNLISKYNLNFNFNDERIDKKNIKLNY